MRTQKRDTSAFEESVSKVSLSLSANNMPHGVFTEEKSTLFLRKVDILIVGLMKINRCKCKTYF
jgi:hypothetical protein